MPGIDYSAVRIGRKRVQMLTEANPGVKSLHAKIKRRISQG